MPIYEYTCSKCGKRIEVIQKMSDKPLKTHEKCGGKLTKEISASGFQFKGTGWYVTDYARKGQPQESSSESSKETKTETSQPAETSSGDKKETTAPKSEKSEKSAKPSKPTKS